MGSNLSTVAKGVNSQDMLYVKSLKWFYNVSRQRKLNCVANEHANETHITDSSCPDVVCVYVNNECLLGRFLHNVSPFHMPMTNESLSLV